MVLQLIRWTMATLYSSSKRENERQRGFCKQNYIPVTKILFINLVAISNLHKHSWNRSFAINRGKKRCSYASHVPLSACSCKFQMHDKKKNIHFSSTVFTASSHRRNWVTILLLLLLRDARKFVRAIEIGRNPKLWLSFQFLKKEFVLLVIRAEWSIFMDKVFRRQSFSNERYTKQHQVPLSKTVSWELISHFSPLISCVRKCLLGKQHNLNNFEIFTE